MKKILFIILTINFVFFLFLYSNIKIDFLTYLNKDNKNQVEFQNKEINKKKAYIKELKKIDLEIYNLFKEENYQKKINKECKSKIKDVSNILNLQSHLYLNYLDYKNLKYRDIIKCNIYKANNTNELDIQISYKFLKTPFFKSSLFDEYILKGYKINWLITFDLKDIRNASNNIFRRIEKEKTNSISLYVKGDNENNKKYLKNLYLYYYRNYDVEIFIGSKGERYLARKINYITKTNNNSLKELIKKELNDKKVIKEKIYLNLSFEESKKLNIFELNELIENTKITLSYPNSIYFKENNELRFFKNYLNLKKRIESEKIIKKSDFELIYLKYKNHFKSKE